MPTKSSVRVMHDCALYLNKYGVVIQVQCATFCTKNANKKLSAQYT